MTFVFIIEYFFVFLPHNKSQFKMTPGILLNCSVTENVSERILELC